MSSPDPKFASSSQNKTGQPIDSKKRGNKLGFLFFQTACRLLGLRAAYGLLYFVCLYYLFFDRIAVANAMAYISKRYPRYNRISKFWLVYLLFVSQGKQLIDRYATMAGANNFKFSLKGYEHLLDLINKTDSGFILLTSHMGNWQIALTALEKLNKNVYLLMRKEDNPAVQDALGVDQHGGPIQVVSPEQYLGGIFEIMEIIKKGHILSMMGDRSYGAKTLKANFLGHNAKFPFSAFSIAMAMQCPVVVFFAYKTAFDHYVVDVSRILFPRPDLKKTQKEHLKFWMQTYANILEQFVLKYPDQCFLFEDIWE